MIQAELHNRLSHRDEEDRLQSELQGDEYEFTLESGDEYQDIALVVDNIALKSDNTVLVSLRLDDYECPTSIDDWEEDITYLYLTTYLYGSGSAKELSSPLLSDIEVTGHNPRDIRISMYVYSTYQSSIWHAIERIAETIHQYHSDYFLYTRKLYTEIREEYIEDTDSLNMNHGLELAQRSDHHNVFQATLYLNNYFDYRIDEDAGEKNKSLSEQLEDDF